MVADPGILCARMVRVLVTMKDQVFDSQWLKYLAHYFMEKRVYFTYKYSLCTNASKLFIIIDWKGISYTGEKCHFYLGRIPCMMI